MSIWSIKWENGEDHIKWVSIGKDHWLGENYSNRISLQVERIELSDKEASHKADDGKPPEGVTEKYISTKYLSKLERGFHWNSIQPWGENCPKKRLILPLQKLEWNYSANCGATPVGGNLVETPPVVGFQSKPPESP